MKRKGPGMAILGRAVHAHSIVPRRGGSAPSQEPIAGVIQLDPDELGVLDDALMRYDEAAVGGYVECPLVTRRGSEGASGGAHHPLI